MDLFDFLVTRENVSRSEPDPECYLKAMEMAKVSPADCIAFEDSSVGIEAAENAGVQCFAVRGYN